MATYYKRNINPDLTIHIMFKSFKRDTRIKLRKERIKFKSKIRYYCVQDGKPKLKTHKIDKKNMFKKKE